MRVSTGMGQRVGEGGGCGYAMKLREGGCVCRSDGKWKYVGLGESGNGYVCVLERVWFC